MTKRLSPRFPAANSARVSAVCSYGRAGFMRSAVGFNTTAGSGAAVTFLPMASLSFRTELSKFSEYRTLSGPRIAVFKSDVCGAGAGELLCENAFKTSNPCFSKSCRILCSLKMKMWNGLKPDHFFPYKPIFSQFSFGVS